MNDWVIKMSEKEGRAGKLSPITINKAITCFHIMLDRAVKDEYIHKNPITKDDRIDETFQERGAFTLDEIKQLFSDDSLELVWNNNLKYFTANILSLTTGMRQGEVLGLQVQAVYDTYITVMKSWSKNYGLVDPKWQGKRFITMPKRTSNYLHELINQSPYQNETDLVFYGMCRDHPINDKTLLRSMYSAIEKVGIDDRARRERRLTYHSWRHTFNTVMRGKIPDVKLRKLTGHKTEAMTDRYTHFSVSDFQDVLIVQEEFF